MPRPWYRTCAALGAAGALAVAGLSVVPAHAAILPTPVDCPTLLATDQAVAGLTGTGWTVEKGTTPDPFSATVLGRIDNGIAPGVDMIMARLDSPALEAAGGVWAGMSGSPVYTADGKLIGSVSYGLAAASPIAGITPAASLADLLDNDPDAAGLRTRSKVAVPRAAAQTLAATGEVSTAEAVQGFRALPMPLNVSGVSGAGADRLAQRLARRAGVRVTTGGAAASAAPAPADSLFGGSNFAAAVSYGYVTLSAVGTTTYTCAGKAVAFGHPFLDAGVVSYSAHPATAVYIQEDPVFGPFKVANPGGVAGTVDRDRTLGIRAQLGQLPTSTTIYSTIGRTETRARTGGVTHAVFRDYTADAAAYQALYNVDKVMGSANAKGSFTGTLTVSGTRANGSAFSVLLGNSFAAPTTTGNPLDFQVADWVYGSVSALVDQPFDTVTLTRIKLNGMASSDGANWRAPTLTVQQNGRQVNPANRTIQAPAGFRLWWKGVTQLYQRPTTTQQRATWVVPPRSASGRSGYLLVGSGEGFEAPSTEPSSFAGLLAALAAAPRNDEVRIELRQESNDRLLSVGRMRFSRAMDPFGDYYQAEIG